MRTFLIGILVLISSAILTSCSGGTIIVQSTPRPIKTPQYRKPTPPEGQLKIPHISEEWTPVSIGTNLGSDLAAALRQKKSLALILSKDHGTSPMEEQVFRMVKAVSPDIKVVMRGREMLDKLMEERGEIPYRITLQPGGTDVLGRPFYLPKEHPLNTEWISKREPLNGAEAMLVLRQIHLNDKRLNRLRKGRVGNCDNAINQLQKSTAAGLKFFTNYKAQADTMLQDAFQRHLSIALPYWKEELNRSSTSISPGSQEAICFQAYSELINSYTPCLEGDCRLSPKLYPQAGGIVGILDGSIILPNSCPLSGMRNYSEEIKDISKRSVSDVLPSLNGPWTSELTRFSGLDLATRGIVNTCEARHRRIIPEELNNARAKVGSFLSDLTNAQLSGTWELAEGQERIPSVGTVHKLARVIPSGRDVHEEAAKLTEMLRNLDRCNNGKEKLLQASLIDVGSSQVLFMGIFFEEELLCENLSPEN